jgi:hypothetical protein
MFAMARTADLPFDPRRPVRHADITQLHDIELVGECWGKQTNKKI